MRMYRALLAASLVLVAAPALGQTEFNGAEEISRADYASAERVIEKSRKIFPHDVDLMLNLATVYQHTGRTPAAVALYQAVLTMPDEALAISDTQDASAHALAREGLRRISPVAVTAR